MEIGELENWGIVRGPGISQFPNSPISFRPTTPSLHDSITPFGFHPRDQLGLKQLASAGVMRSWVLPSGERRQMPTWPPSGAWLMASHLLSGDQLANGIAGV